MKQIPGLKGELLRFALVGGIAVAIDGAAYLLLNHGAGWDPAWSKRLSFALGALWAFVANKWFTFQHPGLSLHEPLLFALVYAVGWTLNSLAHDLVYRFRPIDWLAFLVATGISTLTNFAGQKWIVFRHQRRPSR